MEENTKDVTRGSVGFGSSYRKGTQHDLKQRSEIGAVLGGQIWIIKPDKDAKASNPCLWMQASVVEFKNCNNFYDCTTCKYDQGMLRQVEKGKQVSWQDAMRRKPSLERLCRHTLTRRIERRACAYNYECSTCDFDQFFELDAQLTGKLVGLGDVIAGFLALEPIAGAADRETLVVKQRADLANHQHVLALVIATIAPALDRLELGKFLLPVTQHVRLHAAQLAHFADGEVALARDHREFVVIAGFQHMLPRAPSVSGQDGTSRRDAR